MESLRSQTNWFQRGIKILPVLLYTDCIEFLDNWLTINVMKAQEWEFRSHD